MPPSTVSLAEVSLALTNAIRVCPAPDTELYSDLHAALVSILAPLTAAARASTFPLLPWQPTLAQVQQLAKNIYGLFTQPEYENTQQTLDKTPDFIREATALHLALDSRGLYTAYTPSFNQQRLCERIALLLSTDNSDASTSVFGADGDQLHVIFRDLNTFFLAIESLLQVPPNPTTFAEQLQLFIKDHSHNPDHQNYSFLSTCTLHTPITVNRFLTIRNRINQLLNGPHLPNLPINDGRIVVKLFHLLWGGCDLVVEPDDVDDEREYMKRILDFDLSDSDIGFPTTIGASSFSVVYEANYKVPDDDWSQTLWRTRVAVKMFLPDAIRVDREPYFRQVALRINTFSNPCLLMVHTINWPQGILPDTARDLRMIKDVFVVSELMTHNLRAARKLPALASFRVRLKVLADVASALAYLHRMGVAHMGVTPENVLVRVQNGVLYGNAKLDVTNLVKHALFPSWRDHFANHTWLYRPPESLPEENLFFTSDSWSFGVLACFLMSSGGDRDERFYSGQTSSKSHRKLVRSWCGTIANQKLREFITPCLRENQEDRPAASQLAEKMKELLDSFSTYIDSNEDDDVVLAKPVDLGRRSSQQRAHPRHPYSDSRDLRRGSDSSSDENIDARRASSDYQGRGGNHIKRRAKDVSSSAVKRRRLGSSDSADPDWSITSGPRNKNQPVHASSSTGTRLVNGRRKGKRTSTRKARRKSGQVDYQSLSNHDEPGLDVESAEVLSLRQESGGTPKSPAARKTHPGELHKNENGVASNGRTPNGVKHKSPRSNLKQGHHGGFSEDDGAILIERSGAQNSQTPQRLTGMETARPAPIPSPEELAKAEEVNKQAEALLESGQPGCMEHAAVLFKQAADAGSAKAQVSYGHCLEYSRGVPKDFGEAAYYFQLAAENGNPQGQLKIGLCHEFGRGTKKDYKVAAEWYKRAAEQGNNQAQVNLGIAYQHGRGTRVDYAKAAELYTKAAEAGLVVAKLNLGVLYDEGCGVPRDPFKAFSLYQQAAINDSDSAMLNLAVCYQKGRGCERDLQKAALMFTKAAERGNVAAMFKAGQCYENGEGITADAVKAARFYRSAAEEDDLAAMYNLGRLYLRGFGVEKEESNAFKLFEAASKNGHIPSTVMLAWCYDNSIGTRESTEKALQCYRKAERHGNPRAKVFLGYKYEMGLGVKVNKNTAVRLYRESAAAGCPKGETALGQCYQFGYGMDKCITTAVGLYERAVEKGDDGACEELGKLCRDGTEVERDEDKAFKCFKIGAEAGNVTCMLNYGEFLYYGKGTEKDVDLAILWFKNASKKKCAEAYRWLGDCYSEGAGVELDSAKAAQCFQKGADLGSTVAQTSLGVCYENGQGVKVDASKAVELYRKASAKGNSVATNNLGILYEKGELVRQDYTKAFKYYQKARNGGNVDSICNLADCYAHGHGVLKNVKKAFELYQEASDLGQPGAQCELGACYYYGRGVETDFKKAVELFRKASGSEPEAVRHLGTAYYDGNGVEQDFNKAYQLFVEASESGNDDAFLNVAVCWEFGQGVDKDVGKAAGFYRRAMETGNKTAARCLGNFYMQGIGVEKNEKEAFRLFRLNPMTMDEIMS